MVITRGTDTYYLGRDTSGDLFFGTSEAGIVYLLSVSVTSLAVLRTGAQARDALQGLTGNNRLDAAAIKNLPSGGSGGSGLDQDAVDARISARVLDWAKTGNTDDVPIDKLPSASSSQGGVLSENDYSKLEGIEAGATEDQTGEEIVASLSELTGAARLPATAVKDLPTGGGTPSELTAVAALPAVADSTLGDIVNYNGVLYELIAGTVDPHVYRGVVADRANNYIGDDVFSWQGSGQFDISVHLSKAVLGASPPTNLYIEYNGSNGQYAEVELARTAVDDTATTYGYGRATGSASIDSLAVGGTFSVTFYTDEDKTTPFTIQSATDNRWEADNREITVLPEARQGNTSRWPKSKLPSDTIYTGDLPVAHTTTVFNEQFPGFTVTSAGASTYDVGPNYFSPTFDLDTAGNTRGEFHCQLEISVTSTDVNFGFEQGKANQTLADRKRSLSAIVFASDLAETQNWASSNPERERGVTAFQATVYSGPTLAGHIRYTLTHNANNEVGIYYFYEGLAGSVGFTVTAELRVSFTPSDAPVASAVSERSFVRSVSPSSAVSLTTPGNNTAWSTWTDLATLTAITAEEEGQVSLKAQLDGVVPDSNTDSGARLFAQYKIVRTRSSTATDLFVKAVYVRNNPTSWGIISEGGRAVKDGFAYDDNSQEGDIYKLQGRVCSQNTEVWNLNMSTDTELRLASR